MKNIVAIVCEYNPFHNGHLYQIREVKKKIEADYIVAIMSGNFVQRGEPSFINKWNKAKLALKNEVDMVVELPTIYSTGSASIFAEGAIKVIKEMGIVTHIAFGVEDNDRPALILIANKLLEEDKVYKETLRNELNVGNSFPKAREEALIQSLENDKLFRTEIAKLKGENAIEAELKKIRGVLGKSNNILAIEYLKAIKQNKVDIEPLFIERVGNDYLEENITGEYSSGTAIRNAIRNNELTQITKTMPVNVVEEVMEYIKNKSYTNGLKDLNDIIIYKLITIDSKELSNVPDVVEGLENLIIEEANKTNDVIELVNNVKSKRYTQSRIQRILINVVLGVTKKDIELSKKVKPYIIVLGVTEKAKELLSEMNGNVITSVKKYEDEKINTKAKFMLDIDKKASNIYSIISKEKSNKDYTEKLIIQ